MKNSSIIIICGLLAVAVVAIPCWIYYNQFGDLGISDDQGVWGQLGDFLNVWVSLANLILISGLTLYLNNLDGKRQDEFKKLEDSRSRPILVFIFNFTPNRREMRLKNVGNGPALNISFAHKLNGDWGGIIRQYSLMTGDEYEITSHHENDAEYGVTYYDVNNNIISSVCKNEHTQIFLEKNIFSNRQNFITENDIAEASDYAEYQESRATDVDDENR